MSLKPNHPLSHFIFLTIAKGKRNIQRLNDFIVMSQCLSYGKPSITEKGISERGKCGLSLNGLPVTLPPHVTKKIKT